MCVKLSDLSQEKVQRSVNAMAKQKSPKTVKNAHGLLTATLTAFYPEKVLHTTPPQRQHTEVLVPSDADIRTILSAVRGKSVELPVLLAVWLGLRMSEIRGLTWACVSNDKIHIKQAMVDEGLKGTKTYSSDRILPLPEEIKQLIDAQPHKSEYIIPDSRRAIHSRFVYHCEKAGVQHCRFHDLRHANASVMLQLGIPDKYAMQRMGHATPNMLKSVYQHIMPEKEQETSLAIDAYFKDLCQVNPGE